MDCTKEHYFIREHGNLELALEAAKSEYFKMPDRKKQIKNLDLCKKTFKPKKKVDCDIQDKMAIKHGSYKKYYT